MSTYVVGCLTMKKNYINISSDGRTNVMLMQQPNIILRLVMKFKIKSLLTFDYQYSTYSIFNAVKINFNQIHYISFSVLIWRVLLFLPQ